MTTNDLVNQSGHLFLKIQSHIATIVSICIIISFRENNDAFIAREKALDSQNTIEKVAKRRRKIFSMKKLMKKTPGVFWKIENVKILAEKEAENDSVQSPVQQIEGTTNHKTKQTAAPFDQIMDCTHGQPVTGHGGLPVQVSEAEVLIQQSPGADPRPLRAECQSPSAEEIRSAGTPPADCRSDPPWRHGFSR